jgi:enoyl-CoA hydratase/carnithine racemase
LDVKARPDGRVATITIQGENDLNILGLAALAELAAAARRLNDDSALRAVVVTGAGNLAFIGGADVRHMAGLDPPSAVVFITALHEAIAALRAIPVPVIARIDGYCLGAGLEVAAGCDLRLASEKSIFGMPEVMVGIPSVIEAALLPRLVGWGRTAELVYLGTRWSASEARAFGLVQRVVAASSLDVALEDWLGALLAAGPRAIRLQKALLGQWELLPLDEAIAAGIARFAESYESDEPKRMMQAFLAAKRR